MKKPNEGVLIKLEDFIMDKSSMIRIPQRIDCKNGRYYELDGKYKPSVTSFLNVLGKGIGFAKWLGDSVSFDAAMEYANERADVGTFIHFTVLKWMQGENPDFTREEFTDEIIKKLLGFKQFWNQHNFELLGCEIPMWADEYPVAGAIDFILKDIDNGEIWVIDIKTGKIWPSYKYQIAAYADLAVLSGYVEKVDHVALLQLKEYRGNDIITSKDKPKYALIKNGEVGLKERIPKKVLMNLFEIWQIENRKDLDPKARFEYPDFIELEEKKEGEEK